MFEEERRAHFETPKPNLRLFLPPSRLIHSKDQLKAPSKNLQASPYLQVQRAEEIFSSQSKTSFFLPWDDWRWEKHFLQGSSLPAPPPSQMGPDLHDPDKANLVLGCLTRSYNTMCVTSTSLTKFTLGKNMPLILTKKYHLIFLTEHLLFWCTTPVFSFMITS